jgi:6,7-dimethyl-8-ribityllumazine synthase
LLKAAYQRDRENPVELERYQDAMRKLKDSDHYILVMAVPALSETHAALSQMHRAHDIAIYIVIGLLVVGAAIAIAFWRG